METENQIEQSENIKLEKNSRGYNWTIRLNPIPTHKIDMDNGALLKEMEMKLELTDLDRLAMMNNEMIKRFGGKE